MTTTPPSSAEAPMTGARAVTVHRWNQAEAQVDYVAEEVPVALVYNGISHAVMMTSPQMLEAFAIGFTLAEGIVEGAHEIYDLEVVESCQGYEVHLTIATERFVNLKAYRRSMTGRTGCGLCGVESLEGAVKKPKTVPHTQTFDMAHYNHALTYLKQAEVLGGVTGCTHAAVWIKPDGSYAGGTEDVGRHVALDKLIGLKTQQGWTEGALLVSSRASYEMVQKASAVGIEIMFAVSAPTALAVELAQETGLTLAAFCRNGRLNVYTHPERLIGLTPEE